MLELANALKDTSTTASSLELNLLKEFYDDANNAGSYIEINEGTKPVEIHGSSTEELTVGVWVQRDDLTLDKLNFNITDSDKATKAYWTDSSNYYNAILLGKGPTSPYHNGAGLKNVTVTNSTINISGFTFTSGIYVGGVYDSRPDNVEISRNTIIAKGNEKSAVQGLLINVFDKSLIIKNNYISSTYGNGTPPIPYNAPASAFFISTLFDEATTNSSLNISDNTLSCAQYTFYINVLPEDNVVTSAGVKAMREKEFGLPSTKWSFEPAESFAKVVFDNLVGQVDDIGFAFVSEFVKRAPEFEVEQYEIDSKAVVGISYYGDKLVDGHYDNSAWYKGHVVPYGTPNAETDPNGAVHFKHSNPNPNGNTTYPVPSSSTRSFRPRSTTPRVTTPRAKSRRSKVPQTHLESFYR
ncbi:MAG: hypothetical protein LBT59_29245 [Clostridiales bacterium]|nr:hypothetical protein [Clostridiales bacterium]